MRRSFTRFAALIACVSISFVVVLVRPAAVSAHDELVSSVPANGAVVSSLPGTVLLNFEEPPTEGYTKVHVFAANGHQVSRGAVVSNGSHQSVLISDESASGVYTVRYSVLSDDGHPVSGSFTFTVAATPITPAVAAAGGSGGGFGVWWIVLACAAAVLGLVVAAVRRLAPAPMSTRVGR